MAAQGVVVPGKKPGEFFIPSINQKIRITSTCDAVFRIPNSARAAPWRVPDVVETLGIAAIRIEATEEQCRDYSIARVFQNDQMRGEFDVPTLAGLASRLSEESLVALGLSGMLKEIHPELRWAIAGFWPLKIAWGFYRGDDIRYEGPGELVLAGLRQELVRR